MKRKEKEYFNMNNKLKTLVFGGLVAGSLVMSAAPVMARDWHWNDRNYQWDGRYYDRGGYDQAWGRIRGSRSDFDALEQARQQALYDASHHASRKKIAQDNAVVDEILDRMHYGR
jgi:hypothetical protein